MTRQVEQFIVVTNGVALVGAATVRCDATDGIHKAVVVYVDDTPQSIEAWW